VSSIRAEIIYRHACPQVTYQSPCGTRRFCPGATNHESSTAAGADRTQLRRALLRASSLNGSDWWQNRPTKELKRPDPTCR